MIGVLLARFTQLGFVMTLIEGIHLRITLVFMLKMSFLRTGLVLSALVLKICFLQIVKLPRGGLFFDKFVFLSWFFDIQT